MIYKVRPGTKTHEQYDSLLQEIKLSRERCAAFIKKIGAKSKFILPNNSFSGIAAVEFELRPNRVNWKRKKFELPGEWYIPRKNTFVYVEFNALPSVSYCRIAEIANYDFEEGPPNGRGGRLCAIRPGWEHLERTDDFILKTNSWSKWKPDPEEMIEITNEQYQLILKHNEKIKK